MKLSAQDQILISDDGSPTVMSGRFGVTYHSRHGAIQETNHVFIEAGLEHFLKSGKTQVRIFEMGFGTGLNALLTSNYALENKVKVNYSTVDLFPISGELTDSIYKLLSSDDSKFFKPIHELEWGSENSVHDYFSLIKYKRSLLSMELPDAIDLVFYDAFAPTSQPELWTEDVFRKLFDNMSDGAILVTYSCKGDVRRAMIAAGFQVEKIPGPPGKREMIRANVPLLST